MREITTQMRLQEYVSQIEDWRRSGLTQRQWAKAHGMTLEAFKYRKRKVEDQAEELLNNIVVPVAPMQQIVQLPNSTGNQEYERIIRQEANSEQNYAIEINMPEVNIRAASNISPEILRMVIREVRNA